MRLSARATKRISSGPRSGSGAVEAKTLGGLGEGRQRRGRRACRPQAEQRDADDRKHDQMKGCDRNDDDILEQFLQSLQDQLSASSSTSYGATGSSSTSSSARHC
jgi:hypothetical protein